MSTFLAQVTGNQSGTDIFGTVEAPPGVEQYTSSAGGGIGIIFFISNLIKLGTVIAGIWVLFNFLTAGFTFLSSGGDSSAYSKVSSKLTMSVIGLAIIVSAYAIAGVIGLIVFGRADYILSPEVVGPTAS